MTLGAVAAGDRREVAAGLRLLAEGGNAVDAAVGAAFCAFVVEPTNAGPAGYGHLTAWLPREQRFLTVDHGPRAPAAATPDLLAHADGRAGELGWLATGVPGAVAGLCAAHERAGRLPLQQVLAPAIELADAGLPVDWHVALMLVDRLQDIRTQPAAAAHLLRDGDPPAAGADTLDTTALAATLRRIAQHGRDGFHAGPVAAAIERAARAGGGLLTAADLASYRPRVVEEAPTPYRGRLVVTAEDDVGHLLLGLLERAAPREREPGAADDLHLLAEAFAHAFADAMVWAGDPAAHPGLSAALRSAAYAEERAAEIRPDAAAARPVAAGRPVAAAWPVGTGGTAGTTQVVAADADGGLTVVITTIGQDFGGLAFVPEAGVFLNSGMGNFDPRPGRANSIAPGRMPLFGVPAMIAVEGGRAVLGCGGSGGWRITSGVVHAVLGVLDHGLTASEAVAAPRVWCEGDETFVDARVPAAVREELARRGHRVVVQELTPAWEPFGRVSLVTVNADGRLEAASDPPWHGAAAAT